MGARTFATVSIASVVLCLLLAFTLPPGTSLQWALYRVNGGGALAAVQGLCTRYLPDFVWSWLVAPVLVRPAWLLPAAIGLISFGGTATLAGRGSTQARRRRW